MFCSYSILFEAGFPMHYSKQLLLLSILLYSKQTIKLNDKFNDNKYYDIPFDVIKRGPLKVLLIGVSIACLSIVFGVFVFTLNISAKISENIF